MNSKKPLLIANWKMNPSTQAQATSLFSAIEENVNSEKLDVVVCAPFVYLSQLVSTAKSISVGAQNCYFQSEGAFTGEISPTMIKNIGCKYVILGHSERRRYVRETSSDVLSKVEASLKANLIPVICIGRDIDSDLSVFMESGIIKSGMLAQDIIVVYEPPDAISTSEHPLAVSPKDCAESVAKIRSSFTGPVLYGGSVDSQNISGFLEKGCVDGALIGGASLDSDEFAKLLEQAEKFAV